MSASKTRRGCTFNRQTSLSWHNSCQTQTNSEPQAMQLQQSSAAPDDQGGSVSNLPGSGEASVAELTNGTSSEDWNDLASGKSSPAGNTNTPVRATSSAARPENNSSCHQQKDDALTTPASSSVVFGRPFSLVIAARGVRDGIEDVGTPLPPADMLPDENEQSDERPRQQQLHKEKRKKFVPAFCADFTREEQDAKRDAMTLGRSERAKRRDEDKLRELDRQRRLWMENWESWARRSNNRGQNNVRQTQQGENDDKLEVPTENVGGSSDSRNTTTVATKRRGRVHLTSVACQKTDVRPTHCGNVLCARCGGDDDLRCGTVVTGNCGEPGCTHCVGWRKGLWRVNLLESTDL